MSMTMKMSGHVVFMDEDVILQVPDAMNKKHLGVSKHSKAHLFIMNRDDCVDGSPLNFVVDMLSSIDEMSGRIFATSQTARTR